MSSDEDDVDIINFIIHLGLLRKQRIYRNRPNHFQIWTDEEFYNRFRLSKQTSNFLLELIQNDIRSTTNWNKAVQPVTMLLLTLRYLASGSMIVTAADFVGLHKSMASKLIWRVLRAIASLRQRFIKFPVTHNEIERVQRGFFRIAHFPRVVGALDCTHVKIQSPGGDNAEIFRNRKGIFSINVQTVCGSRLRILDIVARWPGSTHDATIFNNSTLRARFEHMEMQRNVLVADSGYQNRNYCLTPLANPQTQAEILYNESVIRTRNCVERSYGIWKRRFPILATGIKLDIRKVQCLIVAAAVLHNIALEQNEPDPPPVDAEAEQAILIINNIHNVHPQHVEDNRNNAFRTELINNYFANL